MRLFFFLLYSSFPSYSYSYRYYSAGMFQSVLAATAKAIRPKTTRDDETERFLPDDIMKMNAQESIKGEEYEKKRKEEK